MNKGQFAALVVIVVLGFVTMGVLAYGNLSRPVISSPSANNKEVPPPFLGATGKSQPALPPQDVAPQWTLDRAPRFEDFPVANISKAAPVAPDLSSHESAPSYRTALTTEVKSGPNFAGHYTVVILGCGSSCQHSFIVDSLNGRVIRGAGSQDGMNFRLDSALLVADAPITNANGELVCITEHQDVRYYVIYQGELTQIYSVPCVQVR